MLRCPNISVRLLESTLLACIIGFTGCGGDKPKLTTPPVASSASAGEESNVIPPPPGSRIIKRAVYPPDQLNEPKIVQVLGRNYLGQTMEIYEAGTEKAQVTRYKFGSTEEAQAAYTHAKQKSSKPEGFAVAGNEVVFLSGSANLVAALKSQVAMD